MKNLLFLTNWILLHADRGKFFKLYKKGKQINKFSIVGDSTTNFNDHTKCFLLGG